MIPWLIIIGVVIILILAGLTMLEVYMDFKKRPKTDMFWCNKHGYFKKEHCLPLFPHLGHTAQNSFACPTCYYQAVFKDPNKRLA